MMMATAVATPVNTPTEESEEESRGNGNNADNAAEGGEEEEEEEESRATGPAATAAAAAGPQSSVVVAVAPHSRVSKLPLARIKALMKADPDVSLASQESVFVIAKATVGPGWTNTIRLWLVYLWLWL